MAKVPRIFQQQQRTLGPLTVNVGVKIGPGGVEGATRYASLFGGMLAAGLVMSLAAGPMQGLRGVAGPTIALAATPLVAALVLLGTLVVTLGIAVLVGKAINAVVGLFVLGTGLAALTMQCGTITDVVFLGAGQVGLAVETAIWGVVVLLCAAVVFRLAGPLPDVPVQDINEAFKPGAVFSLDALKSSLAGLLISAGGLALADQRPQGPGDCRGHHWWHCCGNGWSASESQSPADPDLCRADLRRCAGPCDLGDDDDGHTRSDVCCRYPASNRPPDALGLCRRSAHGRGHRPGLVAKLR